MEAVAKSTYALVAASVPMEGVLKPLIWWLFMFSACDCAPAPVILGYAPDANAVGVIELAAPLDAITLAPNVPALMLAAVKLERFAPLSAGSAPLPFNCTSWLLPLKTLPCLVIEE